MKDIIDAKAKVLKEALTQFKGQDRDWDEYPQSDEWKLISDMAKQGKSWDEVKEQLKHLGSYDEKALDKLKASIYDKYAKKESFKESVSKEDFDAYVDVQMSGVTNMYMIKTVMELSGLEKEQILDIMKNYATYAAQWPDVIKKNKSEYNRESFQEKFVVFMQAPFGTYRMFESEDEEDAKAYVNGSRSDIKSHLVIKKESATKRKLSEALSDDKLRQVAKDNNLSDGVTEKFIKFVRLRFPSNNDPDYLGEWADRIWKGPRALAGKADNASWDALLKVGLVTEEDQKPHWESFNAKVKSLKEAIASDPRDANGNLLKVGDKVTFYTRSPARKNAGVIKKILSDTMFVIENAETFVNHRVYYDTVEKVR